MKAASVNDKLHAEKSELEEALSKGQTLITDMEAKVKNIEAEKKEVDRQVRTIHTRCGRVMADNIAYARFRKSLQI